MSTRRVSGRAVWVGTGMFEVETAGETWERDVYRKNVCADNGHLIEPAEEGDDSQAKSAVTYKGRKGLVRGTRRWSRVTRPRGRCHGRYGGLICAVRSSLPLSMPPPPPPPPPPFQSADSVDPGAIRVLITGFGVRPFQSPPLPLALIILPCSLSTNSTKTPHGWPSNPYTIPSFTPIHQLIPPLKMITLL